MLGWPLSANSLHFPSFWDVLSLILIEQVPPFDITSFCLFYSCSLSFCTSEDKLYWAFVLLIGVISVPSTASNKHMVGWCWKIFMLMNFRSFATKISHVLVKHLHYSRRRQILPRWFGHDRPLKKLGSLKKLGGDPKYHDIWKLCFFLFQGWITLVLNASPDFKRVNNVWRDRHLA